jgi:hypothetical protein
MSKILRLKSWQTFGLIIIIPILLIISGAIMSRISGINAIGTIFSVFAVLTMMISYYGWIWSAGVLIYRNSNSKIKLSLNSFKLLFRLALFLFLIINPILKKVLNEESSYLIQIVGLTSLLSFLYCIYFIVVSVRNIEEERNIKAGSLFLDFILIWILPIGIWFIQPRVKEIFSNTDKKAQ